MGANDKIEAFIIAEKKRLENLNSQLPVRLMKGEVIYSKKETLSKGKYYLLGLNPKLCKENEDGYKFQKKTFYNHLDDFCKNQNDENYYLSAWGNLQNDIEKLFSKELLDCDFRKVFSTNLIFKATNDLDSLNFGLAGFFWETHLNFISEVKPDIIVCIGNGETNSPYSFIRDLYKINAKEYECKKDLGNNFSLKACTIYISSQSPNSKVLLLGIPHLSRYKIASNNNDAENISFNKLKKRLDEIKSDVPEFFDKNNFQSHSIGLA